jgi:hypothetical protein
MQQLLLRQGVIRILGRPQNFHGLKLVDWHGAQSGQGLPKVFSISQCGHLEVTLGSHNYSHLQTERPVPFVSNKEASVKSNEEGKMKSNEGAQHIWQG